MLAVYTGSAVNSLSPVASGDDGAGICSAGDSKVTFEASAGTTYRIAVDGKGGSEGGFSLQIQGSFEDGGGDEGAASGGFSTPAPVLALSGLPSALGTTPRPLKCRPGFKKTRAHGKARCVKKRKRRQRR